ncbi:MAG: hypothetical protein GY928_13010 [Colwellia sp.]|nr:hypothetical protein [Colwellia sp.]
MKKETLLKVFILLCSIIPFEVYSQWYDMKIIEYVYSGSVGGRTAISLVGGNPNPGSCTNTFDLFLDSSNPQFPWMWSIILTSYTKDIPISVNIQGCGSSYNLPIVTDVRLNRVSP